MIIIKSKTKTVTLNEKEIKDVHFDKIAHKVDVSFREGPGGSVEDVESVTYVENGQVLNVDEHPIEISDWTMKMERLRADMRWAYGQCRAFRPLYLILNDAADLLSVCASHFINDKKSIDMARMADAIVKELKQTDAALERTQNAYKERIEQLEAERL